MNAQNSTPPPPPLGQGAPAGNTPPAGSVPPGGGMPPAGSMAPGGSMPPAGPSPQVGAAPRLVGVSEQPRVAVPGPRRVNLSLAHVSPWSIMKLAFLLSVAAGIMLVVATAILWGVLDKMTVFDQVNKLLKDIGQSDILALMEYVRFDRVLSIATIVAVVNVVLLTAIATLFAFLYNITASLVGGVQLTFTDE